VQERLRSQQLCNIQNVSFWCFSLFRARSPELLFIRRFPDVPFLVQTKSHGSELSYLRPVKQGFCHHIMDDTLEESVSTIIGQKQNEESGDDDLSGEEDAPDWTKLQ